MNAAHDANGLIPWSHWLTPHISEDYEAGVKRRVERAVMPFQDYAWTLLNTSSPLSYTFVSSGQYSRYLLRFSLSSIPASSDLTVEMNGKDLGWTPREGIGMDRTFYDMLKEEVLEEGEHTVVFELQF